MMPSISPSTSEFLNILAECTEAQDRLQKNGFLTDQGLCVKVSKEFMPEELQGANCEGLELYFVQQDAVHCLQEIGRLREQAFRRAGGGTHQEIDLDHWDHSGFWQLLCIDIQEQEICGAYRLLYGAHLYRNSSSSGVKMELEDGEMGSVHSLFSFSPMMLENILPHSIELGRSFINENTKRANLALPLMFEALGQVICQNASYVLGKVTFFPETLDTLTLWLLYNFLEHYWGEAKNPLYWQGKPQTGLAAPRKGFDFRLYLGLDLGVVLDSSKPSKQPFKSPLAVGKLEQEPKLSYRELEQLSSRLLSQLPPLFDHNALRQLLQFLDQFYSGRSEYDGSSQSKKSKSTVLRAMTLFLKYVSLLRNDLSGSGMHVFGGAVNPHFGNVIEFMSLVEVQQFRQSNLERWLPESRR